MSDITEDTALYDDVTVDATVPLPEPVDFDVDAWIQGARPTRRAVKVYQRPDLIAILEQMVTDMESSDGDIPDDQVDQFDAIKTELEQSARWFTIEGRSREWFVSTTRQITKDRGFAATEDGTPKHSDDRNAVQFAMLAEQIVIPQGVREEHIARLWEVSPDQVHAMLAAQTDANFSHPGASSAVSADFSRRRSGTGRR